MIDADHHWIQNLCQASLIVAMDNVLVVTYISHLGGTHLGHPTTSDDPAVQPGQLHSTQIRVRHIPGVTNVLSDTLAHPCTPQATEWMLHAKAFQWLYCRLWKLIIDLFSTRFNRQLPGYVSPVLDPQALGIGDIPYLSHSCYRGFENSTAASISSLQDGQIVCGSQVSFIWQVKTHYHYQSGTDIFFTHCPKSTMRVLAAHMRPIFKLLNERVFCGLFPSHCMHPSNVYHTDLQC